MTARETERSASGIRSESGGLFVDMGIHDLDVARWLMGRERDHRDLCTGAVLKNMSSSKS